MDLAELQAAPAAPSAAAPSMLDAVREIAERDVLHVLHVRFDMAKHVHGEERV